MTDTIQGLHVRRVALTALQEDPANARTHGPRNLDAIRGSLARFGQVEPLVVQAGTLRVIAGHGRIAALRELGHEDVDIVEVDVDDLQATALAIALNRSGELAEWDMATLGRLLEGLRSEDAIEGLGFEDAEIDEILGDLLAEQPVDVDDPGPQEPPEEPVTQLGDLWLLGGHRILCGDSTLPETYTRLLAGELASLLATDPPYLVDYDAGSHPPSDSNKPEVRNKGWDAYVDPPTSVSFFKDYLLAALAHCREDVPVYQWHAHRRQALVEEAWVEAGLLVHQQLIWTKAHAVLTRSHFMWGHEPCFYGWPKGSMPAKERRPPPNASTVWPIDQTGEPKGIHPTIVPLTFIPTTSHL